jgi:hypothetical protein
MLAVRWYLRYSLSYRDVEELLAEGGIVVDHVTISRWVQRFTPELIDAARPRRHVAGGWGCCSASASVAAFGAPTTPGRTRRGSSARSPRRTSATGT